MDTWEVEERCNETVRALQDELSSQEASAAEIIKREQASCVEKVRSLEEEHQAEMCVQSNNYNEKIKEMSNLTANYKENISQLQENSEERLAETRAKFEDSELRLKEANMAHTVELTNLQSAHVIQLEEKMLNWQDKLETREKDITLQADEALTALKASHKEAMSSIVEEHAAEVAVLQADAAQVKMEFEAWMDEFEQSHAYRAT